METPGNLLFFLASPVAQNGFESLLKGIKARQVSDMLYELPIRVRGVEVGSLSFITSSSYCERDAAGAIDTVRVDLRQGPRIDFHGTFYTPEALYFFLAGIDSRLEILYQ